MKYPAYPSYKPSCIAWLGDIPEHWDSVSLSWASRRYAGGTPDRTNDTYWEDGTVPWINSGAVNQGLITEPSTYITEEGYRNSSAKWVPKGGLVMALAGQGKTKGIVAHLAIDTTCNQSMAAIIPDRRVVARYLYWWLAAHYTMIRNLAGGEQRDGLNLEIIGSIPCPLFPTDEQRAIADFLDAETAKLDTLIAKKRELIEKLREKRAALISRTVTRGLPPEAARAAGLNPNPKLKPAGIEWLGEVPEHWVVKKIRYLALLRSGENIISEELEDDGEFPVFGGNGIRGYSSSFTHQGHYILIGRQGALCGNVNYAMGRFWASEHAIVVSPLTDFATVWLGELLRSMNLNQYSISAAQPGLSVEMINRLKIPVPPLPEQRAIADYLDRETGKIDRMVEKVRAAIERLQEYRTALITAAVTGKIDVRKLAA